MHVAEVHEPRERAWQRARVAHDHVVVVRVPVNHLAAQPGQRRNHLALEPVERPRGERAARGIAHGRERGAPLARAREVPGKLARRRGVREVVERPVQVAEQPAERAQRLGRARVRGRERRAGKPLQHPDEPRCPVRAGRLAEGTPCLRGHDPRQRQVGDTRLELGERRALHRHERALPRRVHRLQHEGAPVGGRQAEVVVELAGQRPRPGREPVKRRGEPGGVPLGRAAARPVPRGARGIMC